MAAWARELVRLPATAQFYLGVMYAKGHGVPQDYTAAMKWYRLAADQGYADAQFNLGLMQANGQGLPGDSVEASQWFQKAAEQGHARAQYYFGHRYDLGRGVPQDRMLAHMWLNLAAARLPPHEKQRESAAQLRDNVADQMTTAQIVEAQKLAREWRAKHRKK
jgi:hypothetical protein